MPYKDIEKRKEANRLAAKRSRERKKVAEGAIGMTPVIPVIPEAVTPEKRLLMEWAARDDNSYQCRLGRLSGQYTLLLSR